MKITEIKTAYSAQMSSLWDKKQELTKLLQESEQSGTGSQNFDRVEISKELAMVDAQYAETKKAMEHSIAADMASYNAKVAKQQGEAMQEAGDETAKIMTIMRRLMAGDTVPPLDEKKLMEYDAKLYMMAKNAGMLAKNADSKEHDSLWGDEDKKVSESEKISGGLISPETSAPSPDTVTMDTAETTPTE